MSSEVISSSPLPTELRPVTSGGVNPTLPENVTDLADVLEVLSRSSGYYVTFANKIRSVRKRIQQEYPDGDLDNPNLHIKSYDRVTRKYEFEETDRYEQIFDPEGTFTPHRKDAIILGQVLRDDDTVLEGKHWLLGHVYEEDELGNRKPAGKFIDDGLRGDETVVDFKILVRPDFHWVPRNYAREGRPAALPVSQEAVVFEALPRSA